jgi:hypothetical protein
MALLVPDAGEVAMLDMLLKTTTPEGQTLKLYTNNYDAVEGSVAGDFTEASGSGYAAVALTRGTWGGASTAAGTTSAAYPAQVFSFSGALTIVGYFVVGSSSGTILWAERIYAGAGQAFANGDTLTVTPRVELA